MMRDEKVRRSLKPIAWFSVLAVAALLFAGCSTNGGDADLRKLAGTLEDWPGGTGTAHVEIFGQPLLEAPISNEGRFDLTLPETISEDRLLAFGNLKSYCGNQLSGSTEDFKINGMGPIGVTREETPESQVAYQSSAKLPNGPAPVGTVIVVRLYVTKDVQLSGSCTDFVGVLDLTLKIGWNIVIARVVEVTQGVPRLELSSGVIPRDIKWFLFDH